MGLFDEIAHSAKDLFNGIKRFQNKDTLVAVMAGAAYIAAADGELSSEENDRIQKFIRNFKPLHCFNGMESITIFRDYVDALLKDPGAGRIQVLAAVSRVKHNAEQSRIVIRTCIEIGKADGDFDASERAAAREVCLELQQDLAEFGL